MAYFRELLAMNPLDRAAELSGRPESQRAALEAKVAEYAAMTATDRELRLRATELRYFLLPLMKLAPEERTARVQEVPEDIRDLVEDRLMQWTLIPPPLREQLLENQAALEMFSRMNPTLPATADELVRPLSQVAAGLGTEMERWQALSPTEQGQLLRSFNHFFHLTVAEKERTLRTLSTAERSAMERTLKQFESLPPGQREACIRGFHQFMSMPVEDRERFMKNADRWQAMSPEAREEWRKVVYQLSSMPPMPPGVTPVLIESPPLPPGFVPNAMADNR